MYCFGVESCLLWFHPVTDNAILLALARIWLSLCLCFHHLLAVWPPAGSNALFPLSNILIKKSNSYHNFLENVESFFLLTVAQHLMMLNCSSLKPGSWTFGTCLGRRRGLCIYRQIIWPDSATYYHAYISLKIFLEKLNPGTVFVFCQYLFVPEFCSWVTLGISCSRELIPVMYRFS